MTSTDFAVIAAFLKDRSGLIITQDKTYLLETRLAAILRDHKLAGLPALAGHLRQPAPSAVKDKVVDAMTTNETSFFRDSHPFDTLRTVGDPGPDRTARRDTLLAHLERGLLHRPGALFARHDAEGQLPDPGRLEGRNRRHRPFAHGARSRPRGRLFHLRGAARPADPDADPAFRPGGAELADQARDLRQTISFRPLNLLEDFSSLGQFDIVLCRNVLIYFDQPTKTRILKDIASRIAPDGALLLGGAESVFGLCDTLQRCRASKASMAMPRRPDPPPRRWPALPLSAAS